MDDETTLTESQSKALIALHLLHANSKRAAFSRIDIGRVARSDYNSFPMKTMRALWKAGYAEPLEDLAVQFVEERRCRCGCDRWKITDKGKAIAEKQGVRNAPEWLKFV